jgi:hypothetical protein
MLNGSGLRPTPAGRIEAAVPFEMQKRRPRLRSRNSSRRLPPRPAQMLGQDLPDLPAAWSWRASSPNSSAHHDQASQRLLPNFQRLSVFWARTWEFRSPRPHQ